MEAARALGRAPYDRPTLHALERPRPSREEIEALLPGLLERRSAEILAHARRFTYSPEDAEDAYQRGLEILLTKAPATDENELVPWLKTVVKHEAFAISHARGRAGVPSEEALQYSASLDPAPDEQAERYERLRTGAEAMGRLKPQEIQAMVLRAEGHSYAEIQLLTGWSYTKVDRCLKEGRKSFVRHVHGIESGAECAELEPALSRMADGEAAAAELVRLRRHLRRCPGCRSILGAYRGAPRRVAALATPLAALATGGDLGSPGPGGDGVVQRAYEAASVWLHDKTALVGVKLQTAAEAAGVGKIAAVAASSAALAGGGAVAAEQINERERERAARSAVAEVERPASPVASSEPQAAAPPVHAAGEDDSARGERAASDRPAENADEEAGREREPEPEPVVVPEEFAPSPEAVVREPAGTGGSGGGGSGGGSSGGGDGSRNGDGGGSGGGEFAP